MLEPSPKKSDRSIFSRQMPPDRRRTPRCCASLGQLPTKHWKAVRLPWDMTGWMAAGCNLHQFATCGGVLHMSFDHVLPLKWLGGWLRDFDRPKGHQRHLGTKNKSTNQSVKSSTIVYSESLKISSSLVPRNSSNQLVAVSLPLEMSHFGAGSRHPDQDLSCSHELSLAKFGTPRPRLFCSMAPNATALKCAPRDSILWSCVGQEGLPSLLHFNNLRGSTCSNSLAKMTGTHKLFQ